MATAARLYRIFFRDSDRRIVGRQDFDARDDAHAITTARVLWEACSDVAWGYELFDANRCVVLRTPAYRVAIALQEIADCRQDAVVDLEQQMRDSRWAIAKSRRLLVQLGHIRSLHIS